MRYVWMGLFGLWITSFATYGLAETRAVLVGVSDYRDDIDLADLKGPANDVRLLASVLGQRGVTDLTLLADGVDGAALPTRQAILDALRHQADIATAGDFVYIHLSGHGTRQPDLNGDETDGLDEVFLPADVGRAAPGSNQIPNALTDDDIGAAVRAIRAKGADVWLVMDSCHSGSGLRAASPNTAARWADPAVLGVEIPTVYDSDAGIVVDHDTGPEPEGQYLAFYAARSSELAREVNLSQTPDAPAWYGLFTAKLAARLGGDQGLSFRQLFQAILSDMNDDTVPGGARLQTPLWEGPLIDAVVFGGGSTVGLRRFAVTGDEVAAGLLHGVDNGTLVGLVADAADAADAFVGFAQTEDAGATFSYLRPVDPACVPLADSPCDFVGEVPETARFAQIIARPADRKLRLSWPVDLQSGQPLDEASPIVQSLLETAALISATGGFAVELSPTNYSVQVVWDGASLWFGPSATQGDVPVGLRWSADELPDTAHLAQLLGRIAKAEDLARTLTAVVVSDTLTAPNPIAVQVDYKPSYIDDLEPVGSRVSPARECRAAFTRTRGDLPQTLDDNAQLKQCDQLAFAVKGTRAGARDVNRVYIDAQYCVHAAYEHVEDVAAPRALGADMHLCSECPDGYAAGDERVFVIVTESPTNAEVLNLEGLVETCGRGGGANTRGPAAANAAAFLNGLGQRPDTRGSFGGLAISDVWITRFDWRILPRQVALTRGAVAKDRRSAKE